MNPLTQIKNTQKATRAEIELGLGDGSSWHARYAHSAYVFSGGLPFELTEGDLLAVFSQYGEIVDVHLVRDKTTGKSKGFAFLAYEDQRSTVLAVDNLSGAQVAGRTIRVEHVDNYRKKRAEVEGEPLPDEEEGGGGGRGDGAAEAAARAAAVAAGAQVVDEPARGGGGAAAAPAAAPWTGGSSMFDLMAQARAEGLVGARPWREAAGAGGGDAPPEEGRGRDKKERKKEKQEKKERKERRHRHRSRSQSPRRRRRSRSRSRSRDRRRSASPGRQSDRRR